MKTLLIYLLVLLWTCPAEPNPNQERRQFREQYRKYQRKAGRRRVPFHLTLPQFRDFWRKPCTFCGQSIRTVSLSEIDRGKGYTVENVAATCPTCKKSRGDLTLDQWFTQMWKVLQHNDVVLLLKDQPSRDEMKVRQARASGLRIYDETK